MGTSGTFCKQLVLILENLSTYFSSASVCLVFRLTKYMRRFSCKAGTLIILVAQELVQIWLFIIQTLALLKSELINYIKLNTSLCQGKFVSPYISGVFLAEFYICTKLMHHKG